MKEMLGYLMKVLSYTELQYIALIFLISVDNAGKT